MISLFTPSSHNREFTISTLMNIDENVGKGAGGEVTHFDFLLSLFPFSSGAFDRTFREKDRERERESLNELSVNWKRELEKN